MIKVKTTVKINRASGDQPMVINNVLSFDDEKDFGKWLEARKKWRDLGGENNSFEILEGAESIKTIQWLDKK